MATLPNIPPSHSGSLYGGNPESSRRPNLELLEGEGGAAETAESNSVCVVDVTVIKPFEFGSEKYGNRQGRIERLMLSNGNCLTSVVREAHPAAEITAEPQDTGLTLIVPGYGEIPSVKDSSGYNLTELYAHRRPGKRTVAVNRRGYSPHDTDAMPWDTVRAGYETDDTAVEDLLAAARYYAEDKPVTLMGVSAGFRKLLKIVKKNTQLAEEDQLDLKAEHLGIVPCMPAKNAPLGSTFTTEGEPESVAVLKTASKFGWHTFNNLGDALRRYPAETFSCAGIIGTMVIRPSILLALPPQLKRHMAPIEFQLLLDVAENHNFRIVEAEKDTFKAEEQCDLVNKGVRRESISHTTVPGEGHITLPINARKALDELNIIGEEEDPPSPGLLETGLRVATSTIQNIGETVIGKVPRGLGNFVTGSLRKVV